MKKILITTLILSFMLFSCSNEVVIKNKAFIDKLETLNNDLLKTSEDINGELNINLSAGVIYKSSSVEIGINSNSKSNSAYYDTNLSAETIIYLINSLTKQPDDNSKAYSSISLFSKNQSTDITEWGNNSENILTFNSKALSKFYKGNELYLSKDENKAILGENLNNYKIKSELEKIGNDAKYVTTLTITSEQVANVIPFINLDKANYNGNIEIKFYQDSEKDEITRIDLVLFNYDFTTDNDIAYVNVDVVLTFMLPVGGETNE